MAFIGRDGSVVSLTVLKGHPIPAAVAVDAVKRWRYRPTLLNAEPVEARTEIVVDFNLSPQPR